MSRFFERGQAAIAVPEQGRGAAGVAEQGQATVEAAFLLPVLFALVGLLAQPTMLLYNRCVMCEAAAEGCRLLATNSAGDAAMKAYLLRRLQAVPHVSVFHEGADDGWELEWELAEDGTAKVSIANHAQPLPCFGIAAGLVGQRAADGCIEQKVSATSACVPSWTSALGSSPAEWIGEWS